MARKKLAAVVFSLGYLHASSVMALGLGELSLDSFLNEPLRAKVDLLNTGGLHEDEIKIRLATREDFEKLGIDRAYFLTNIKFEVTTDERGRTRVIMSSEDPVLEPYLDFIIEARWPSGRLLREYTVLVDPPVFDQVSPVVSASEEVAEQEGLPAPTSAQAPGSGDGTRVDMRKSDLGPNQMPERDYNAQTSAVPVAGSRYMIQRDDTLWDVARQARPEGASVHQTMLDIQRMNPNAFINGNINQVKAGYIVYLPASGDISSEDLAVAMAEVRQQNEDWQQGRASEAQASSGPSLRISAEPEVNTEPAPAGAVSSGANAAAMEDLDKAALERSELEQRLAAIQEQVDTLQRIVALKDEQLAALQNQIAADDSAVIDGELDTSGEMLAVEEGAETGEMEPLVAETDTDDTTGEVIAEPTSKAEAPVAKPEPAKPAPSKPEPKPAKKAPAESGGLMGYLPYGLGALLIAILGFVFMRRRGQSEEDEEELELTQEDSEAVFADVELQDQQLEVEPSPEGEEETVIAAAPGSLSDTEPMEIDLDTRGYGEHKNDEYASDVDEVDALAEADIYIAYGRYPQAIDLLENAIKSEPGNPAYRLKLLELHGDMDDRDAALRQFAELKAINEPNSLARAEKLLADLGATPADANVNPLDLIPESDEPLEATFSGLEIEEVPEGPLVSEELDLSADFTDSELDQDTLDEDLVVAAESSGLSTKLDLARAYLDMGDEDGARQILEEVAAEGTEELRTEALELLERIG